MPVIGTHENTADYESGICLALIVAWKITEGCCHPWLKAGNLMRKNKIPAIFPLLGSCFLMNV